MNYMCDVYVIGEYHGTNLGIREVYIRTTCHIYTRNMFSSVEENRIHNDEKRIITEKSKEEITDNCACMVKIFGAVMRRKLGKWQR